MAKHGHDCAGKLRGILKDNSVLKAVVSHQHHGSGHGDRDERADERVQPRPLQVGKTQPFLRHAALLEEELPRSNGRAYNSDDQEDQAAGDAAEGHGGNQRVARHGGPAGMHQEGQDKPDQVQQAERDDGALPAKIASCNHQHRQTQRCYRDRDAWAYAHRAERQRDGGELRDQCQEVDQQEIKEGEPPPPFSEARVDHGGVALAGRNAQARHHLLHKVADGQQHNQRPQQVQPVLPAGLHVGRDGTTVVVRHHHNQAGTKDH